MFVRLFKPEFAPLVENGSKCQTVRPVPKRMPKVGDRISLRTWTGKPYRSKQRVLRESTITRVCRVEIWPRSFIIAINGKTLSNDAINDFAIGDGFRDYLCLFRWFFEEYHCDKFKGIVIYWEDIF